MSVLMRHLIIVLIICVGSINTHAAELPWSDDSYSLYANQDNLRDILVDLAASQSIPTNINPIINDEISAHFEDITREKIFHQLVNIYGLIWYYDGHQLYIDRLENMLSKTIKLKYLSAEAFRRNLKKLGIIDNDDRFYWRAIDNKGLIYISGPEIFVTRVVEMASQLDDEDARSSTIYKWKDTKGRTHYSSDLTTAPRHAEVLEINERGISRLSSKIEDNQNRNTSGKTWRSMDITDDRSSTLIRGAYE